jgi:hypothetical protein
VGATTLAALCTVCSQSQVLFLFFRTLPRLA